MAFLTALIQLVLFVAVAVIVTAVMLTLLFRLTEANSTIDRILDEVYDWDAEGDFDGPPWTREKHAPLLFIGPETVTVRCTCGYVHVEPIRTTQGSAYRVCTDEFWSTHMREVAA